MAVITLIITAILLRYYLQPRNIVPLLFLHVAMI